MGGSVTIETKGDQIIFLILAGMARNCLWWTSRLVVEPHNWFGG